AVVSDLGADPRPSMVRTHQPSDGSVSGTVTPPGLVQVTTAPGSGAGGAGASGAGSRCRTTGTSSLPVASVWSAQPGSSLLGDRAARSRCRLGSRCRRRADRGRDLSHQAG